MSRIALFLCFSFSKKRQISLSYVELLIAYSDPMIWFSTPSRKLQLYDVCVTGQRSKTLCDLRSGVSFSRREERLLPLSTHRVKKNAWSQVKRYVIVPVYLKHVHSKYSINIKYVIFILYVRKIRLKLQVPLFIKKNILYIILSSKIYMTVCKYIN